MKIAILGADPAILELVRAVCASGVATIVAIVDDPDGPADLRDTLHALASEARLLDHWEGLLGTHDADAVLVARAVNEDAREEQLRKLAQTETPLLVSHPVVRSMLIYYELDMIRRDTGAPTRAYLPDRHHPAVAVVKELCRGAESPLGRVDQVIMERRLDRRTREGVLAEFARDVDLLRALCGEFTRLGALGAGGDDSAYASLGVQMNGPGGFIVRWSVMPFEGFAAGDVAGRDARILMIGSTGRATLTATGDARPWRLEMTTAAGTEVREFDVWDPAVSALQDLAAALADRSPSDDWIDAARSLELAETIPRSLHKGRTIELHYDDYTEEATFKGLMSSLGCGLLMAGLAVLALVSLGESMGVPGLSLWRYIFLGVLAVFLLIQTLAFVFPKDKPSGRADH